MNAGVGSVNACPGGMLEERSLPPFFGQVLADLQVYLPCS